MVLSAADGVLLVARVLGGVIGRALENGAVLAAIAGVVCLALAASLTWHHRAILAHTDHRRGDKSYAHFQNLYGNPSRTIQID